MANESFAQRALAAFQEGDLSSAERWVLEARRTAPHHSDTLLAWGVVMNALGQFEAAAEGFRALTQRQPGEPIHWMNLATAERAAGRLDAALDGYERAAQIGGWTADLLYNTALLELQRGHFVIARERLAHAMTLPPIDAEIACCYAQMLMQSGEPAARRAAVNGWQQWHGWTLELLADFGMMLLTVGDQTAALGIVERLCLAPNNPPAVEMALVTMLERTNQPRRACAGSSSGQGWIWDPSCACAGSGCERRSPAATNTMPRRSSCTARCWTAAWTSWRSRRCCSQWPSNSMPIANTRPLSTLPLARTPRRWPVSS
jgi:Flp pilus assembly protein TadD